MLVKTKFNVSDETYNAFAQISDLPKLYSVKGRMKDVRDYIYRLGVLRVYYISW